MKATGLIAIVVAAAAAAAAAAVAVVVMLRPLPPAQAFVRDCPPPRTFDNVVVSSVRNMSCAAARTVMRRHNRPIFRAFTTSGFRCVRVSGGDLGGQWRCVSGARVFRFDFGD